jgi:hypothetical protein
MLGLQEIYLVPSPTAPPGPFYRWLGIRVLVGCDTILESTSITIEFPYSNSSFVGSFLGHNLRGLNTNMNEGYQYHGPW